MLFRNSVSIGQVLELVISEIPQTNKQKHWQTILVQIQSLFGVQILQNFLATLISKRHSFRVFLGIECDCLVVARDICFLDDNHLANEPDFVDEADAADFPKEAENQTLGHLSISCSCAFPIFCACLDQMPSLKVIKPCAKLRFNLFFLLFFIWDFANIC